MKIKGLALLSLALAIALAIFAFVTAGRLPEGAMLPTHWNAAGEVDRSSPALQALLMPPALILFITGIFAVIPRIEPLQDKLEGSAPVLRASWIGLLFLMTLLALTIGLPAYGVIVPVKTVLVGTGVLLMAIGNALPKSRPGFFVGVRTPWAIIDTDNWIATHRLAGKLMMLAGLGVVVAGFLPLDAEVTATVLIAVFAIMVIVPYVYSWLHWERKKRTSSNGTAD